jgi:hypothetical protein
MTLSSLVHLWRRATVPRIAMAVGAAGLLAVALGLLTHAEPYAAPLGYDSAMTVGVFAFALALLGGVGYRQTLEILAPLIGVQIIGALRHHVSPAPIGTELCVFAVVGLGFTALHHRLAASPPAVPPRPALRS